MPYVWGVLIIACALLLYGFWPFFGLKKQQPVPAASKIALDEQSAISHLCRAISCETTGYVDEHTGHAEEFRKLHRQLEEDYPKFFETVTVYDVKPFNRLYRWEGSRSGKKPIMLMAHQDVVPVTSGTEKDWAHPPFAGTVADGFIWGRGAIDMKNSLCGIFEAMEHLIGEGFVPDRDVYFLTTCDEEILGPGSPHMLQLCRDLGLHFEFVLDEGGSFLKGDVLGVKDRLLACVCTYEKGYCDVRLTTTDNGGHSAAPKAETALSRMARALMAIETNEFPIDVNDTFINMYKTIAPYCDFMTKWMAAHPKKYARTLAERLAKSSPYGNALVRTTTALTQIKASDAPNVLPQKVVANVNFRINYGFNYEALKVFVQDLAGPGFLVEQPVKFNPTRPGRTDTKAFAALSQSVRQTFGEDIIVTPMVFFAGTDSRMFDPISDDVYKFMPAKSHMLYASGMHGTNERIEVPDYLDGIRFYIRFIRSTCRQEA